jgi:hypothetical protein
MAQVIVANELGIAMGNAAIHAASLAREAFDMNNRLFPGSTSAEVFDAISLFVAAVDVKSFLDAMATRHELLARPSTHHPFSPMDVSHPSSLLEEREISQTRQDPLEEKAKSPSPHSPPHKRQRAGTTAAAKPVAAPKPFKMFPTEEFAAYLASQGQASTSAPVASGSGLRTRSSAASLSVAHPQDEPPTRKSSRKAKPKKKQ